MRKASMFAIVTFMAISWAPVYAVKMHEGHSHTVVGKVALVEETRLDVKDTDTKVITFVLNEKTVYERAGKTITRGELKVDERVAVEFEQSADAKIARRVRSGIPQAAAVYTCPMHSEVVSDKPGKCPMCGMYLVKKTD